MSYLLVSLYVYLSAGAHDVTDSADTLNGVESLQPVMGLRDRIIEQFLLLLTLEVLN